jgi:hypothetical protein
MAGDCVVTTSLLQTGLHIRELQPNELSGWDALVRRFANHRVVHTTAWLRSLEASGFGRPLFLVVEKHAEVVACFPGLLNQVGPLRLFGSPPPASQTVSMGPAFDDQSVTSTELLEEVTLYLERTIGVHHIEVMSPDLELEAMRRLGFREEPWPTYRMTLFPGDERRTLRQLKDSARRNITRGVKQGLEVRFESDESFVEEHFQQIQEVYVRGGHAVNFKRERVLQCFRHLRAAGNLIAVSVYLPNRVNIATGMFTIEGGELLLWTWAHRTQFRWHRPTELMTWTVIQEALRAGCTTFDFLGLGVFKTKFGAELDTRKYRWIRSRYRWLGGMRQMAAKGMQWQQVLRARLLLPLRSFGTPS